MPAEPIHLKGITWNHSRGFVPMAATAQRFAELHPGVEISWQKRSLQQFADESIQQLAERFDLLVIDHPWAGFAARTGSILPLDEYLPADYLIDQQINTVGHSFESYAFSGHQWALPIDAATPVAASRPDLLARHGLALPDTFADLLALADRGLVAFSLIPIDTLMSFYMFCCSLGEDPCQRADEVVSAAVGRQALQLFRELASKVDPACFHRNPIQVYEAMTQTDALAYCPFAYGYANYARPGYARRLLHFHDMVRLAPGGPRLRSTLGGTGLAISATCPDVATAVRYAEFVASPTCQQTLYFDSGGQPGHLSAWQHTRVNAQSSQYFAATLPALQRAFLRPRYHGHLFFQDHAGEPVRHYLQHGGDEQALLDQLNSLYRQSRTLA